VIPLDNQRALDAISGALMPSMVRAFGVPANQDFSYPALPISPNLLSPSTMAAASSAIARESAPAASTAVAPQSSGDDLDARMERIAEQIGSHVAAAGTTSTGDTHIYQIKGLISPDNLKKVIKQQNRMVQNRQATVKATDSQRLTRRSQ
jgi:hypothetical protein